MPKTHKGVNIEMGQIYSRTSFNAQARMSRLEDFKEASDYAKGKVADEADATSAIQDAEAFID